MRMIQIVRQMDTVAIHFARHNQMRRRYLVRKYSLNDLNERKTLNKYNTIYIFMKWD